MTPRCICGYRKSPLTTKLLVAMTNASDIENRLRKLESRYRHALSAAVAAKARYLALHGESSSTAAAVARAKREWHILESRRALFATQMRELEELEHESVI
jgi:hypothetical protein